MINRYKIVDHSELGLSCVEVHGKKFHYQDLFEITGQAGYMTTFYLKDGSESYLKYGKSVLGIIFYEHKKIKALNDALISNVEISEPILKIDSPDRNLAIEQKKELKYRIGINVCDVQSLSYLPYQRETAYLETGEKMIPNVVNVPFDSSDIDVDMIHLNHLERKLNKNIGLAPFEIEALIGITLAFNQGHIKKSKLRSLNFKENNINGNLNIWFHLYKVRERRGQMSERDKENYSELKNARALDKFIKVLTELNKCGLSKSEAEKSKDTLKRIFESVESFEPSILVYGSKQIYWDIDSYIHIALGHVKDLQLGDFKVKTPFLYRVNDLKSLIEKVLSCVEDEWDLHVSQKKDGYFNRRGSMGIVFNGDHYHIMVDPSGRLTQFHMVSDII